jgi:hypothetical protein
MALGAHEPDRSVGIVVANPATRCVAGHPAADDQVSVFGQGSLMVEAALRPCSGTFAQSAQTDSDGATRRVLSGR